MLKGDAVLCLAIYRVFLWPSAGVNSWHPNGSLLVAIRILLMAWCWRSRWPLRWCSSPLRSFLEHPSTAEGSTEFTE
jgi:hypothetical protein